SPSPERTSARKKISASATRHRCRRSKRAATGSQKRCASSAEDPIFSPPPAAAAGSEAAFAGALPALPKTNVGISATKPRGTGLSNAAESRAAEAQYFGRAPVFL